MILYRSIGVYELERVLVAEETIHGHYNNATEPQNTDTHKYVICCHLTPFRWRDKNHKFDLILDIPDERVLNQYDGTYYVSKNVVKTRIWTGRRGCEEITLPEAVISEYSVADIKEVSGLGYFANWYYRDAIEPAIKKYGIKVVA